MGGRIFRKTVISPHQSNRKRQISKFQRVLQGCNERGTGQQLDGILAKAQHATARP